MKNKLNEPDVEPTLTTFGESITINKTIPSQQFKDMFVTGIAPSVIKQNYTEEEIIKEWEELGYEVKEKFDDYHNGKAYKRYMIYKKIFGNERLIVIKNYDKTISLNDFWKRFDEEGYPVNKYLPFEITFQEHQLLTKTFKMLGWDKENNND